MLWYELKNLKKSDSMQISADIHVPSDSPWFCGHFPGEPILPGIAQLGMVYDAINRSGDQNLEISNISRVRFKQIIRPNDQLKIIKTHTSLNKSQIEGLNEAKLTFTNSFGSNIFVDSSSILYLRLLMLSV